MRNDFVNFIFEKFLSHEAMVTGSVGSYWYQVI